MISAIATLKVAPGKNAEFEAIFIELQKKVRGNEPGVLLYQLTRSREDPQTYRVLEIYKDAEAQKAHGATDYLRELGAKMGPCMAARMVVELLDPVG